MTIGALGLPTTPQTTTPQSVLKNYHASDKSRSPIILGEGKAKTSVLSDYYVTNRSAVPVSLTPSPSLYLSNYEKNPSVITLTESHKHALTGYSIQKGPVTLSSCPTVKYVTKGTSSGILNSFHITGQPKDEIVSIEAPHITLTPSSSLYLGGYSIHSNQITLNKSSEPGCIQPTLTNYTTRGNVTLSKSEKKETYYWDGKITGNVKIKSIECNDKTYTIEEKKKYEIGVDSRTNLLIIEPKAIITTLINADADIDLKSAKGFKVENVFTIPESSGGMILDISFNGDDRLTLKVSTTASSQPLLAWVETPKNHLDSYSATNQDSISLSESTVNNAKTPVGSDYTYNNMKLPSILEEVTRDHRKHCKSKFGDLYDKKDYESILKGIIKKQKGICCDDIDLSKHVLKSSIVPCANLIPDKYKKYAEKYKPGEDGPEEEQIDIHKENVEDKFSISFIASMIFIIVIILMKLL